MDTVSIIFRAIELIPKFLPGKKPPVIDYTPIMEALPKYSELPGFKAKSIEIKTGQPEHVDYPELATMPGAAKVVTTREVSTACLSCSRSHLSTVSGALGESLRFARENGIGDPEVQRRLMLAEDEINIMERIDLSADALAKAKPEERQVAEEYLPKIRAIRQKLGSITSLKELEDTAAEASVLGQEFRLRHLQLQGVNLNPVLDLARKVQSGELSMDEAKMRLKTILPDEE